MGIRASRRDAEPVARITSAPESPASELEHRERRYVISMTIRTLCFLGAVVSVRIPWLCILLLLGSLVLPYVAVVMANSASPRPTDEPIEGPGDLGRQHRELGGG